MLTGFACAAGVLLWLAWAVHRCERFMADVAGEE